MAAGRSIEAGRAFLRLLFDGSQAEAGLKTFERRIQATGRRLTSIGATVGGLGVLFTAPFVAATRAASDAQETFSKFEQVLGTQTDAARQFLSTFSGGMIQSRQVSEDTFASIFAQFRGLGSNAENARKQAELLTAAIADFESFNNLSTGDGLTKFASALAGEVEPLRRFGIELSAARIDQQLQSEGRAAGAAASAIDKLNARTTILLQSLKQLGVLGDVSRTAGNFANQARALRNEVTDLAVAVGSALLPAMQKVTPPLVSGLDAISDFVAENPRLVQASAAGSASLLAFGGAATGLGFVLRAIVPYLTAGATAMAGFAVAAAGVVSVVTGGLLVVAGLLAAGIVLVARDQAAAAQSAEDLAASYQRYSDALANAISDTKAAGAFQESADSARALEATLRDLIDAQRQLNALEAAGQGRSDEARNLRDRLPALEDRADQQSKDAAAAATRADPFVASERFRKTIAETVADIKTSEQALALAKGRLSSPELDGAVDVLQSRINGLKAGIEKALKKVDPAAELIGLALRDEVEGGTADDPQKRLGELKQSIGDFVKYYRDQARLLRRQGAEPTEIAQVERQLTAFQALQKRAAETVPSRIAGRDAPVLAGDEDGARQLDREARQRATALIDAEREVSEAKESLIADETQRRLKALGRETATAIADARKRGDTLQSIDAIREASALKAQRIRQDRAKEAAAELARIDDQTNRLVLSAQLAGIAANPKLTELEKRIQSLQLQEKDELSESEVPKQRDAIRDRFRFERELANAEDQRREVDDRRRRVREARQLEVSSVFNGSVATALQLGPDSSVPKKQLTELEKINRNLNNLRPGFFAG